MISDNAEDPYCVVNNLVEDNEELSLEDVVIEKESDDIKSFNNIFKFNNFIIMHVNIRSINANIDELELLIGKLKSMPTIIICSETWHLPCPILNGYQMYYNNSKINRADGSVIFIKSNFEH